MIHRFILIAICAACFSITVSGNDASAQERAFGRVWGGAQSMRNWERFYHYPYVYYPQNFWGNEYYRSSESLYYRYPPEMRIPVYNKKWHNYYPSARPFHSGHQFILDVF
jgi:hypothetical protein